MSISLLFLSRRVAQGNAVSNTFTLDHVRATDIALRVVMGRLCHPVTIGSDEVDLGLCPPTAAPLGLVPFTDGAPVDAGDFDEEFPYLTTPLPGAGG